MTGEEQDILFERHGALGLITLNRPRALNALTRAMCVAMREQLQHWKDDREIRTVLVRGAGERAFCAGGDVRALYESRKTGTSGAVDFYRDEYRLNAAIKHFAKPYVALLHGIVMGGGVGVSVHGSHRLADASAVFAMPETGIGLFPDVGGSYFLPRMPGETGLYVALTGERLKMADLAYAGISTHNVPAAQWDTLIARLSGGDDVEGALDGLSHLEESPPLAGKRAEIDRLFAGDTVEAILAALDGEGAEWARSVAATIRTKSPTSLKLTLRQLRQGRSLGFDDCMRMEFRMVNRVIAGHDFYEGVRATIIDKDGAPRWRPEALAEIRDTDVDACFAPLADGELRL
ncbi:MAG TPA: enoyl-CoA hydratase/isomerase family protein [Rhizomicrobium sp.]